MANRTTALAVIVFAICVASVASAFAHQQRTHELSQRSYPVMVMMDAPSYDYDSIGNFPYP